MIGGVPNIPIVMAEGIALRAEDVLLASNRLVDVELERLHRRGVLHIEVEVVDEVRGVGLRVDLLPPERGRVRFAALHPELHGLAVEGGRAFELRKGSLGSRTAAAGAGTGVAPLPTAHL